MTAAARRPGFARRLLRRPVAVAASAYLLLLVGAAVAAPVALPAVKSQNAGNLLLVSQGPGAAHLLGTDTLGRDVLERLLVGTQVTMLGVAEALVFVVLLGVPVGLAAGYRGGWIDRAVTWAADIAFSVPAIVVIIVILAVFRENMLAGMATFGLLAAPGLMRVVRSAALPVRGEQYIDAARVSGLSDWYIVTRHVIPRVAGAVIVQASFLAATALAFQSGLAFLSLLVPSPAPSWGGMVADGTSVILENGWLIWPPGIAIALTIFALCLLGDAIRDATTEAWTRQPSRAQRPGARPSGPARTRNPPERPAESPPARPGGLLSVRDVSVSFGSASSRTTVIDRVSLDVAAGEIVGVVGESGSGKSVTVAAILGMLPAGGHIDAGTVRYAGRDLVSRPTKELAQVRGREIGYVAQEPMISLDPAFRIGHQLQEALRWHLRLSRRAARSRAIELLGRVRLPDPAAVARRYPHELSGGMAQRVAIARALAAEPSLLIADEPTTALDVSVQAEILDLFRELSAERSMAVLLVTHDWGVVADICDRVVVMYAGQVVEQSPLAETFREPLHPYTAALLASDPRNAAAQGHLPVIPGGVPQPGHWPGGCRFHPRCALAVDACGGAEVALSAPVTGRQSRCLRTEELVSR